MRGSVISKLNCLAIGELSRASKKEETKMNLFAKKNAIDLVNEANGDPRGEGVLDR